MDLITAWEAETGNAVEDHSGMMDEIWFARLKEAVLAGAADVVVLPLGSGLTDQQLVRAEELTRETDIGLKLFDSMKEAYKRLDAILSLREFVKLQIGMYGENTTAKDMLHRLNNEQCGITNNLLEFFKNK
jgi:hypothetical protein